MKTIDNAALELKPFYQYLLSKGWTQPKQGYEDRYTLEHPATGHTADELSFPTTHLGIINKAGTDYKGAFGPEQFNEFKKFIDSKY